MASSSLKVQVLRVLSCFTKIIMATVTSVVVWVMWVIGMAGVAVGVVGRTVVYFCTGALTWNDRFIAGVEMVSNTRFIAYVGASGTADVVGVGCVLRN